MKNYFSDYKEKRVLITGGLGMIGSNLAHKLVGNGAKVSIISNKIDMNRDIGKLFNIYKIQHKIELFQNGISDKTALISLVEGQDYIFNLAGQVNHNYGMKDPKNDAINNYFIHLNLLEVAKKYNPKVKIIFPGSRLQYGEINKVPVDEMHPCNPKTPYSFHKLMSEKLYLYYHRMYGMKVICFRLSNVYGIRNLMGLKNSSRLNDFIKLSLNHQEIKVFGDGQQKRDYIYVDDVMNAFLLSGLNNKCEGEVLNLGFGKPTKFIDMVSTIVKETNSKYIFVPWPDDYINIETGNYYLDITKIKNLLGWFPKISLENGIKETVEYYKKYGNKYWRG